jgi:hypothetical protein
MVDQKNTNDSDPYVDLDPDLESSVEVVEKNDEDSDNQVSIKKIIFCYFIYNYHSGWSRWCILFVLWCFF